MATPAINPRFSITFGMVAGLLTFTDTTSGRSANTKAIIKATYTTDGTPLYTHPSWGLAPADWEDPDIDGSTPVWTKDIPLPDAPLGSYLVEYQIYDGATPPATAISYSRTFTLKYVAPVVAINETVRCSTSQLISSDDTDYNVVIDGVEFTPTTITRAHTITKPAGSGYTGTLGTTSDAVRTIGGGSIAGTRLWTRIWQTNIVTGLTYRLATWGAVAPDVYVTDVVKGDDQIFAQCDTTICALAQCYANMLTRWNLSLTGNFEYKEGKRDEIIKVEGLFIKLLWFERCGVDVEPVIAELKDALKGEKCGCTTDTDEVSKVIIPWAAMISGGGSGSSTFAFLFGATDPNDADGNDDDVYTNTVSSDIFKKLGGHWTFQFNNKGASGHDLTGGGKVLTLISDSTERSTAANLALTQISYDFQLNNSYFENANDYMLFHYEAKFNRNQNGKLLTLRYAGADVLNYFADDMVLSDNERVEILMKVTPISDVRQHLEIKALRNGQVVGPTVERNHECDLNTTRSVALYGTNSEESASDVMCDCTIVTLYKRETDLVPAGVVLSRGRGLVAQTFTATEGQTDFTVTLFEPNDMYIPMIDNVPQSQLVVTRNGYVFTYAPGLAAGQVLTIID